MQNPDLTNIASEQINDLYQNTFNTIGHLGSSERFGHILTTITLLSIVLVLLLITDFIFRKVLKTLFTKIISSSKTIWDDKLLENKVLDDISHLVLILIAQQTVPHLFVGFHSFKDILIKALSVIVIISIYKLANALLKTLRDILKTSKAFFDKPLDSYLQVIQIFLIFVVFTVSFSIITGNSPWSFLVSLGAASAILMLVFKDTILGFVASIQVSANDSVRVGDWIEMQKYGADGSVIQINLNNVKVQNFDKTIVTLPTHALLSDSFKNYRGMQQSGGRRIKRAIYIKISSIRYLTNNEIEELKKIHLLKNFIAHREQEIADYNLTHQVDETIKVNGRRMTNIGLFRAYIEAYLNNNKNIHKEYPLMVRHLEPTEHGLPLEIYAFTQGTEWLFFEGVMADLFDHIFAAIKYFHLETFELPASDDLRLTMSLLSNSDKHITE
ncbi:mechanosensitive ion channel [Sphingobacterium sp. WQ 366]|uniref:Mechanosensitive ion channel n=2 Tax=Sphingobacterium bovistauri TaxID=2781959 RepID=A0ABS7Z683_9SPHI|nr:mechanosensitive ion channel [Sphingobacterium bovistauri]